MLLLFHFIFTSFSLHFHFFLGKTARKAGGGASYVSLRIGNHFPGKGKHSLGPGGYFLQYLFLLIALSFCRGILSGCRLVHAFCGAGRELKDFFQYCGAGQTGNPGQPKIITWKKRRKIVSKTLKNDQILLLIPFYLPCFHFSRTLFFILSMALFLLRVPYSYRIFKIIRVFREN